MESIESKMAVLIESVSSLSRITANHDTLLTKLVDDHEQRIRLLEKCSLASAQVEKLETRVRELEAWKWYIAGGMGVLSVVFATLARIYIT
jgi:hypothetical protein